MTIRPRSGQWIHAQQNPCPTVFSLPQQLDVRFKVLVRPTSWERLPPVVTLGLNFQTALIPVPNETHFSHGAFHATFIRLLSGHVPIVFKKCSEKVVAHPLQASNKQQPRRGRKDRLPHDAILPMVRRRPQTLGGVLRRRGWCKWNSHRGVTGNTLLWCTSLVDRRCGRLEVIACCHSFKLASGILPVSGGKFLPGSPISPHDVADVHPFAGCATRNGGLDRLGDGIQVAICHAGRQIEGGIDLPKVICKRLSIRRERVGHQSARLQIYAMHANCC
mmetsp:Transcript_58777/g.164058  ORF Transcript_58777/g.164058 Transcript_58777/m.164058 type:complete len:276 (+) Transcript_58777:744-1571(+)